ncbi:MAG: Crp/Fnr family transcriptional regulator [Liquorilactobacillus hordei]|uniref:Crp/Fnr family transcriptional regulator n=1 Tax=Liquorilactobacillus hordei TaxID=468911 RepID=UPI0039EA61F0
MDSGKKKHLCVHFVPIFAVLDQNNQEQVEQLIHYRQFKQGEQLFRPGNTQQLFIVARGTVKVYQLTTGGKEQFLRMLTPGEYEGETWLFGDSNNSLYAESTTDSQICILHRTDLQQLLKKSPALAIKLLENSVAKTITLERQNKLLVLERIEERLAAYLVYTARVLNNYTFTIPMKMKELAAFLGTTPETLSRKFKILEQVGYIERQRRQVVLTDTEGLESLWE